jgi:Family of unknown function (DUF6166)
MHKTYRMRRINGEADAHIAWDGHIVKRLDPRYDLANHSPDGFEWGYGGSGPAQLAIAILADALGTPRQPETRSWMDPPTVAERLHQPFKWEFIASRPHDDWSISEEVVLQWVAAREESRNEERHEA